VERVGENTSLQFKNGGVKTYGVLIEGTTLPCGRSSLANHYIYREPAGNPSYNGASFGGKATTFVLALLL
jgi:hypothetical protein